MSNRYEQVLLTYLRQWQWWAYVGAWVLMFPLLTALPSWWGRQMLVFVFLSLVATGPAAVIGHAKLQIADARASLVPGFRTPHVVVAVGMSVAAIVLLPLLTHAALDVPVLGLIASVAAVSVAFAAIAYFQSLPAILAACAGVGLLMLGPVRETGEQMLMGGMNGLASAVLAASGGALAGIFRRLAVLHEGTGEYARVLGDRSDYAWSDARLVPPRERLPDATNPLTRLQLAAADRRLRAITNVFSAGPWRRVRHWMLSGEMSGTKWLAALVLAAFLTCLPLLVEDARSKGDQGVLAIGAIMSVLLPVFCVTATWMSRRRSMGYELTRPIPRQQFVREFGLAIAADMAEWWLWLTLAAAVPLLVWGPPVGAGNLAMLLALSAGEQVLAFGILVTVLRMRSPRASDGSIMVSIIPVIMPLMLIVTLPRSPATALTIAAGATALGAALTYDAYRRWCETDLA